MNIILHLLTFILPIVSVKQIKPKLCINCKYFIPHKDNINKYGKCSFFPKKEYQSYFLVDGISEKDYYFCSVSRSSEDMCDEEGKYYKKKIIKNKRIE